MQFTCAICYDSLCTNKYEDSDETDIVSTICGHVFHKSCILIWLKEKRSCPECRIKIRKLTKLYINFCGDDEKSWNELNAQLSKKKAECLKKREKITELLNKCYLAKRRVNSQEEQIVELHTCFANSEIQILEKNLEIEELQTNLFLSEQENSNKDKKIKELKTFFANFELRISEKDARMGELQTCLAHSKIENTEKDNTIKELQTSCSRLELEISKKEGIIEDLQARFSQSELIISKKDEKREMKLIEEISAMKREAEKLSCVEDENQNLVQEKKSLPNTKNILMSELEHLQTVKTTVEERSIDVIKKILEDAIGQVSSDDGKKGINRIATYCSLPEQELLHSKEVKANSQSKTIKIKQKLTHSKKKSTHLPNELKLVKLGLRKSHLKSAKEARQLKNALRKLREQVRMFKDLNS